MAAGAMEVRGNVDSTALGFEEVRQKSKREIRICVQTLKTLILALQNFHTMSYVSSLYHIVFTTYRRKPVITDGYRHNLYAVIAEEIKSLKSKALIINGTQDHIHILLNLHQSIALAEIMRNIKSKSSVWMKTSGLFPLFEGWEKEYGAFSLSAGHKEAVYAYILDQQNHHAVNALENEYRRLVMKAGLQVYSADK
ncbi:MAG: transposase [Bacteroides sp.]|nr:transposase [Bacteroides sp.]